MENPILMDALGGSSHRVVNQHGDRFRPLRLGLFPFQMAVSWLSNGGDPNYLLIGMILQVGLSFLRDLVLCFAGVRRIHLVDRLVKYLYRFLVRNRW